MFSSMNKLNDFIHAVGNFGICSNSYQIQFTPADIYSIYGEKNLPINPKVGIKIPLQFIECYKTLLNRTKRFSECLANVLSPPADDLAPNQSRYMIMFTK